MRWCWPSLLFACLTRPSILAFRAASSSGVSGRCGSAAGGDHRRRVGRQDDRLNAAGRGLQYDGVVQANVVEHVLDVLREHLESVGQRDDVAHPARQHQVAALVEPANIAGPVPAVGGLGGGRRLRVLPVAGEDGWAPDEDLAGLVVKANLDRWLGVANGARRVVLE